jgi:cytochrome c5
MNALKLLPLALVIALTACGQKNAQQAQASPAPAAAPADTVAATPAAPPAAAPVPAAEPAAPAAAPATTASTAGGGDLVLGEKIFGATCATCHSAGVLGAPKAGDKTAWGPRIAQGKDTLYKHGLEGFKMMPAKGGNAALKDDEVKAAIDYMVSKAG